MSKILFDRLYLRLFLRPDNQKILTFWNLYLKEIFALFRLELSKALLAKLISQHFHNFILIISSLPFNTRHHFTRLMVDNVHHSRLICTQHLQSKVNGFIYWDLYLLSLESRSNRCYLNVIEVFLQSFLFNPNSHLSSAIEMASQDLQGLALESLFLHPFSIHKRTVYQDHPLSSLLVKV